MIVPVGRNYQYIEVENESQETYINKIDLTLLIKIGMWILPFIPLPFFILMMLKY